MRAYGVTVSEVATAVRRQNLELPGGRVDQGASEVTVRTQGKIVDPRRFNDIVVARRGTYPVKVSDIGHAEDTSEEQRTAARLNGQPAVTLVVSKQSGQNTVEVAAAVKQRLEEIKPILPADFRTEIVSDQSIFINAAIESIETHLIEGGLLAAIVVFFFLWNFRSTLIAAIAIPTSIISTFGLMAAMGYTLNQITMLALTLMVGIVIDDAIIVLENIYRFVEEKGMSPFHAAIEGTREIGLAVMATTLSLLAVFVPVGFMGGIVGRFMSSFGLTSAFAIGVSLIVSFTLTPMLAARLIKRREAVLDTVNGETGDEKAAAPEPESNPAEAHKESKESRFYRPVDRVYTWLLHWSMAHRWAIVALSLGIILSIVPLFMVVGINFTPVDDQSQFEVTIRTAEGSSLAATSTVAERIASDLRKLPGVGDTLTTIGRGEQQRVNEASIYVKLTPIEDRDLSQQELMVRARDLLQKFPQELHESVQPVAAISGGGFRSAEIQYVVSGPDLDKLAQYSQDLLSKIKTIPDVVDEDTTLVTGKPEFRVVIDRARAADLGVDVTDISQALNTMVAGQEVSTFNVGQDIYDVRVRATGRFRKSAEDLKRLIVPSSSAGLVSLDSVVRIEAGTGPSSIERLNRQRQVTVLANVRPGGSQSDVIAKIDEFIRQMKLPAGYTTAPAGTSKELAKSGYYFVLAFALSFIFMYMILAAQFESLIHPVTILLTLPMAVPFGILSLMVTGQTVNIFSGLGLLLLFGIVKKNAILQIDHTNGLRETGMTRYDAIIQANRDRLRPILMTTIALVAGMMPLIVSSGPGSGTNRSIGVLVVGGQSLCLLITLLAVPVYYSLFEDMGEWPMWKYIGGRFQTITIDIRRRFAGAASAIAGALSRKSESEEEKYGKRQADNTPDELPRSLLRGIAE